MRGESVSACTSATFDAASLEATSLAPESPIANVSCGTSSHPSRATNGRTRTETRLIGTARRSRRPPPLGQNELDASYFVCARAALRCQFQVRASSPRTAAWPMDSFAAERWPRREPCKPTPACRRAGDRAAAAPAPRGDPPGCSSASRSAAVTSSATCARKTATAVDRPVSPVVRTSRSPASSRRQARSASAATRWGANRTATYASSRRALAKRRAIAAVGTAKPRTRAARTTWASPDAPLRNAWPRAERAHRARTAATGHRASRILLEAQRRPTFARARSAWLPAVNAPTRATAARARRASCRLEARTGCAGRAAAAAILARNRTAAAGQGGTAAPKVTAVVEEGREAAALSTARFARRRPTAVAACRARAAGVSSRSIEKAPTGPTSGERLPPASRVVRIDEGDVVRHLGLLRAPGRRRRPSLFCDRW